MAEEAKKIYKYREADMDRDSFIQNLNHNYKNYVESQSWTDDQKRAFREAYDAHMEALKKGKLESDIDGSLIVMHDDDDNRFGNSITDHYNKKGVSASNYDSLKKRKKRKFNDSFYANREVVSYFDIVADALYNKKYASQKTEKGTEKSEPQKTKFNNKKNDVLGAFIYDYTGGNGNLDYDNWLRLDMNKDGNFNENPYKNRLTKFYNFLTEHIKDNEFFENIDYSNTAFKNKEEYRKRLQALQQFIKGNNSGSNLVDLTDHDNKRQFYTLLNNLGVDVTAAHKMFTGKNEEENKEASGSTQDTQSVSESTNDQSNTSNGSSEQSIELTMSLSPLQNDVITTMDDSASVFLTTAVLSNRDGNFKEYFGEYIIPYIQYKLKKGDEHVKNLVKKHNDMYYIPDSYNKGNGTVVVFTENNYGFVPIDNLGLSENDLESVDSNNANNTESKKSGGILRTRYFDGGGNTGNDNNGFNRFSQFVDSINKASSQKTNTSTASNTKGANNGEDDIKNETSDEGFNKYDIARLGALALDIGALVDPEPFSSTGLSFIGTGVDLMADLTEKKVTKVQALKSFGINAGLSLVSLIPVVGGAGKIGKIGKTLAKYTAKIGKWLLNIAGTGIISYSAYSAIENTLDKIKKSGIKSLSVDDFRNLYTVLTAIVSGRNAVKGAVKIHKINELGTAKDVASANVLDVKLRNEVRDATQRKTISDGSLVKDIKYAYNMEEGSVQAINNALAKYGYKSYTLAPKNVKSAVRPGFDESLLKEKLNTFNSNDALSWWDKYNPFSAKTDWYRYVDKTRVNTTTNKKAGGRLLNFIQGPLK